MKPDNTVQQLRRDDAVLLVIDEQDRLLPSIFEEERVRQNTIRMIRGAKALGVPVLATEQYPQGIGPTAADVAAELQGVEIIQKMAFSTFGESAFIKALEALGRRTLIVVGIEAHVCVTQSVLDALAAGYSVHVIADAVSSRAEVNWQTALARLRQAGAVISCTEMALFELTVVAGTSEFKEILKLVK